MDRLKTLAWLGCCVTLLLLSGCWEQAQQQTDKPLEVLETQIKQLDVADDTVQTRYGRLEITRSTPDMPPDTLLLDGKQVFQEEAFYLSLHQYITQDQRDLVLFGSNCGGTGCPTDQFHLLSLEKDKAPQTITQDAFSAYPEDLKIRADGKSLIMDMGFAAGKRKTAVLLGNELNIVLEAAPKEFLGDDNCQWLHTDGLTACAEYRDVDPQCTDPQADFTGYLMRGVAGMADYPGFDAAAFTRHCTAACLSGQPVTYETFAKETCSKP